MASDQENSQDANAPDDTSEKEITRGITIMKSIIRDRDKAVTYNVNWNADNQLIGSNAAKLASYIGTLVRMHIPITATRWSNKELGSAQDKIWTEILRSFNIEDTTIRKNPKKRRKFQESECHKSRESVKSHVCIQKRLDETKSDATSLPPHVLWKEARVGKDGTVRDDVQHIYDECVFAQGSQQLSQKIGSRQKNKRDLPVTSLPKKGAFVPRYQISLETLVDSSDMATAGVIRLLDMEEDIFGYSCTETIGKEDLEHIFRHQELGVGVIHTYIRFLYDNFMRGNDQLSNRFRFVSSSLVNKALICREPDSCREYLVKRFMASSTNNLYLWPYNSGCHWLFLAIDPLKEVVYFLNSIDGEWTNYPDMKQLVDTSIKVFRSQRQARVPRTKSSNITWIKVQCPLQRNGIDCGYFVMRFMREIINMNQIEIPITYFDEYKCAHYTRLQLEQIKEELCQYFIEKRLISI
ncbi:hypothetical protein KIW84_044282 [Lathyrus oleraceus]|uniref:Ubiquitin-like protease family profile domain-containing protein n=1 Tax=Pisum sativum TaxID=3888 RepID=A0A9D5AST8_PEA|nr:hypothetical protein KIW84_044282 [Pisum sativum]